MCVHTNMMLQLKQVRHIEPEWEERKWNEIRNQMRMRFQFEEGESGLFTDSVIMRRTMWKSWYLPSGHETLSSNLSPYFMTYLSHTHSSFATWSMSSHLIHWITHRHFGSLPNSFLSKLFLSPQTTHLDRNNISPYLTKKWQSIWSRFKLLIRGHLFFSHFFPP